MKHQRTLVLAVLAGLAFGRSAWAQPAHPELVAQTKQRLEAAHVDLSGACGAFAITSRVAWALRGEGAGLLDKPAGNNCRGFATDIVAYPGGVIVDILGDGGNANSPQWAVGDPVDASRYRPAIDPGDVPVPAPTPAPTIDLAAKFAELNARLDILANGLRDEFDAINAKVDALAVLVARPIVLPPIVFPVYRASVLGRPIVLRPDR